MCGRECNQAQLSALGTVQSLSEGGGGAEKVVGSHVNLYPNGRRAICKFLYDKQVGRIYFLTITQIFTSGLAAFRNILYILNSGFILANIVIKCSNVFKKKKKINHAFLVKSPWFGRLGNQSLRLRVKIKLPHLPHFTLWASRLKDSNTAYVSPRLILSSFWD